MEMEKCGDAKRPQDQMGTIAEREQTLGERFEQCNRLLKQAERNVREAEHRLKNASEDHKWALLVFRGRQEEMRRFLHTTGYRDL